MSVGRSVGRSVDRSICPTDALSHAVAKVKVRRHPSFPKCIMNLGDFFLFFPRPRTTRRPYKAATPKEECRILLRSLLFAVRGPTTIFEWRPATTFLGFRSLISLRTVAMLFIQPMATRHGRVDSSLPTPAPCMFWASNILQPAGPAEPPIPPHRHGKCDDRPIRLVE
jgi:hypothetical protein